MARPFALTSVAMTACPKCNAPRGSECTSPTGVELVAPHQARRVKAGLAPATKKVSGPTIPEEMRKTESVKLRMRPELAAALRDRARREGVTLSALVERLIDE